MQPRIYTYKVTFEEVPHWYWGVHKEKKFGEKYLGSPVTHRWMWEFYTPKIQILEFFPYTQEGWEEAGKVEDRLILPDFGNPLNLNEHWGSVISLEQRKKGATIAGRQNVEQNRGIYAPGFIEEHNKALHERLEKEKKSFWNKEWQEQYQQQRKNEQSFFYDPEWQKQVKAAQRDAGIGFFSVESKIKGNQVTNSTLWEDPLHPELGSHHFNRLRSLQRKHGLPDGRANRVKVGTKVETDG